tara:strand:- start:7614 stop:9398 length:1785 start_codon:yes stop_codon:yes gene_type:complete
MSTPQVDKYSSGNFRTAEGQEVPQYNVASGIGLDAWRNARTPQAPLQPPPPNPIPPFGYRTYGGGVHPAASNGQFPPQFNVGNQASVDLYQSAYPNVGERIDLNPHADWYGGMSGLYFSTGFPFPNPPAGYNIQEATALEIASMGGFEGLSALGGNVATNDQFLSNMTSQYGEAFGGAQTDIPVVKIDAKQIAEWGWLVGMVLGGIQYNTLLQAQKPRDPNESNFNPKLDLPSWSSQGATLVPAYLYSIVMDSKTTKNIYLGGLGAGNNPTKVSDFSSLPNSYQIDGQLTGKANQLYLKGLSQTDIREINQASMKISKKSVHITTQEQDLLNNLRQLINSDNTQSQSISKGSREFTRATNSQYTTDIKGQVAKNLASPQWIENFSQIIQENLHAEATQEGYDRVYYQYYIDNLKKQGKIAKVDGDGKPIPEKISIEPLKPNFGQSQNPLGYLLNPQVYQEIISTKNPFLPPSKIGDWKVGEPPIQILSMLRSEGSQTTKGFIEALTTELKKLSTQQEVANKSNISLAIAEINKGGIQITPEIWSKFSYPPIPALLGQVGKDIDRKLQNAYAQKEFYSYYIIDTASGDFQRLNPS